jgi:hypothetical protein
MVKTVVVVLTEYFNSGGGKRSNTDWLFELRMLTVEEKRQLAEQVCAVTGDTDSSLGTSQFGCGLPGGRETGWRGVRSEGRP